MVRRKNKHLLLAIGVMLIVGFMLLLGFIPVPSYCLGATVPFFNTCVGVLLPIGFFLGIIIILLGAFAFFRMARK